MTERSPDQLERMALDLEFMADLETTRAERLREQARDLRAQIPLGGVAA